MLSQTLKWHVEMNICAVGEFHLRGLRRLMICRALFWFTKYLLD